MFALLGVLVFETAGLTCFDAMAGDAKARDWLARWLLGVETRLLTTLAAEESGPTQEALAEDEIALQEQKLDVKRRVADRSIELSELVG